MSTISAVDGSAPGADRLATSGVGVELAVVTPAGVLDERALGALDEVVTLTPTTAVVVDLTDCVLTSPATAASLDVRRWGRQPGDVCIVCRRLTARRLLFHLGVALPVFSSVQDASQALVLGEAGYGRGWQ